MNPVFGELGSMNPVFSNNKIKLDLLQLYLTDLPAFYNKFLYYINNFGQVSLFDVNFSVTFNTISTTEESFSIMVEPFVLSQCFFFYRPGKYNIAFLNNGERTLVDYPNAFVVGSVYRNWNINFELKENEFFCFFSINNSNGDYMAKTFFITIEKEIVVSDYYLLLPLYPTDYKVSSNSLTFSYFSLDCNKSEGFFPENFEYNFNSFYSFVSSYVIQIIFGTYYDFFDNILLNKLGNDLESHIIKAFRIINNQYLLGGYYVSRIFPILTIREQLQFYLNFHDNITIDLARILDYSNKDLQYQRLLVVEAEENYNQTFSQKYDNILFTIDVKVKSISDKSFIEIMHYSDDSCRITESLKGSIVYTLSFLFIVDADISQKILIEDLFIKITNLIIPDENYQLKFEVTTVGLQFRCLAELELTRKYTIFEQVYSFYFPKTKSTTHVEKTNQLTYTFFKGSAELFVWTLKDIQFRAYYYYTFFDTHKENLLHFSNDLNFTFAISPNLAQNSIPFETISIQNRLDFQNLINVSIIKEVYDLDFRVKAIEKALQPTVFSFIFNTLQILTNFELPLKYVIMLSRTLLVLDVVHQVILGDYLNASLTAFVGILTHMFSVKTKGEDVTEAVNRDLINQVAIYNQGVSSRVSRDIKFPPIKSKSLDPNHSEIQIRANDIRQLPYLSEFNKNLNSNSTGKLTKFLKMKNILPEHHYLQTFSHFTISEDNLEHDMLISLRLGIADGIQSNRGSFSLTGNNPIVKNVRAQPGILFQVYQLKEGELVPYSKGTISEYKMQLAALGAERSRLLTFGTFEELNEFYKTDFLTTKKLYLKLIENDDSRLVDVAENVIFPGEYPRIVEHFTSEVFLHDMQYQLIGNNCQDYALNVFRNLQGIPTDDNFFPYSYKRSIIDSLNVSNFKELDDLILQMHKKIIAFAPGYLIKKFNLFKRK